MSGLRGVTSGGVESVLNVAESITINAVGTAQTVGFTVQNTTAAAAGAQQYSPMVVFTGYGWKTNATAASQETDVALQLRPVQGAAAPTVFLDFLTQVAGGGWTRRFSVGSDGSIVGVNANTLDNATSGYWTSNGGFLAAVSSGYRSTGALILNEGGSDVFLQAQGGGPYRITMYSEMAAATAGNRFQVRAASQPTAGNYFAVIYGASTGVLSYDYAGQFVNTVPSGASVASAAGATWTSYGFTAGTVTITGTTAMTTSPSVTGLNIGTITVTDASAVTITSMAGAFVNPPTAAGSVTATNTYGLLLAGTGPTVVSATAAQYSAAATLAHTVTLTGTTQMTNAASVSALALARITVTDASAVTVDSAATLYIANSPLAAGSVLLTKTYSIWTDAGLPRFDSTTPNGTVATAMSSLGPTGSNTTIQEWYTIDINGTTRYIPCF